VPATPENRRRAQEFLDTRSGGGGTEMMKAIKASLDPSDSQSHVRIVCFMTDGYVGNDMEIISEVKKHPNARVFAFGIGSSVNRFLLEQMAEHGRGEVEFVGLNDDGSAAARRFHERVRSPLLTDISVDWNGMSVADVYPELIPDLFSAKPVVLKGRYTAAGHGFIRLKGKMSGREFVREIPVDFPETNVQHDVLAPLWARSRIDSLMAQDFKGVQQRVLQPELKEAITGLGLEFRLMTQFTSFVAVEEMIVTDGGVPRRVDVPVEVPEGVNRATAGVKDERHTSGLLYFSAARSAPALATAEQVVVTGAGSNAGKRAPRRGGNISGGDRAGSGGGGVGTGKTSLPITARRIENLPDESSVIVNLSPEEEKRQRLIARLHPSLVAVVDRLRSRSPISSEEARFVRDGKAELQVWLTDKSPEAMAQLKQLGFEVILDPKTSKMVIGRLAIEKLKALAELDFVRYVTPQTAK
jgi:Ca-activated chloride channel family protein